MSMACYAVIDSYSVRVIEKLAAGKLEIDKLHSSVEVAFCFLLFTFNIQVITNVHHLGSLK